MGPATWSVDDGQKHGYLSYINPLRINKKKKNILFSKKETGPSERKEYEETNVKHVQTCQLIHEIRKRCFVMPTGFAVLWANRPCGALLRTLKVLMGFLGFAWQNVPHDPKMCVCLVILLLAIKPEDGEKAYGHRCPS